MDILRTCRGRWARPRKEGEEEPMLAALGPSIVFENVVIEHFSATVAGGGCAFGAEQKHHHFRGNNTHQINILIAAEAKVTTFVELTAEIGVISIYVTVSLEFINAFDVITSFALAI
jgi:hypothetical protein